MRRSLSLLALLLPLLAGCGASSSPLRPAQGPLFDAYEEPSRPGWLAISSSLGGFSGLMPGSPRTKRFGQSGQSIRSTRVGTLYAVSFFDDERLTSARRSHAFQVELLSQLKKRETDRAAEVLDEGPEALPGRPGKRVFFKRSDGRTEDYRCFAVGNRVYELLVLSAEGEGFPDDEARLFFSSFRLAP